MRTTKAAGKYYSRRSIWKKRIATAGENLAEQYLIGQGYSIVARNWRAGRVGEIDLIAVDPQGTLVFVEVKTRTTASVCEYGIQSLGFEAIDRRKQRKIIITASRFLQSANHWSATRFDAIVVVYDIDRPPANREQLPEPSVIHIPNAFGPR